MKSDKKRLTGRHAARVRLTTRSSPASRARAEANARLAELKDKLTRKHLAGEYGQALPALQHAANDAASMAWASGFPLLVFPELLEERVSVARDQAARQDHIRRRSAFLLGLAE